MAANSKSGIVLAVGQPQTITAGSGKQYAKRALYIDATPHDYLTGERSQYENKIMFEFIGDRVPLLDNIKVGQIVTVSFDLQGSELRGQDGHTRYFIHVRPYKVEVRQSQQPSPQQQYAPQGGYAPQPAPQYQPQPQAQQFPPQTDASGEPMQNDLPFN